MSARHVNRESTRHRRRSSCGDFRRFWPHAGRSPSTDCKLRFYGSVLGYVWTLARPFAFFGVIYFVFTEIVDLGDDVKNYGVYILFALVLFHVLRRGHERLRALRSSRARTCCARCASRGW